MLAWLWWVICSQALCYMLTVMMLFIFTFNRYASDKHGSRKCPVLYSLHCTVAAGSEAEFSNALGCNAEEVVFSDEFVAN